MISYSNYFKVAFISAFTLGMGGSSYAAPSPTCNPADSTTVAKITACISKDHLTSILQDFQNISDSNPDPTFSLFASPGNPPPGSRDAGTAGDIASVNYIVNYMQDLGYTVKVQSYHVPYSADKIIPIMAETSPIANNFSPGIDFSSPTYAPSGDVTAHLQAISSTAPVASPTALGCKLSDFANFTPGNIALLQRGTCPNHDKVANATLAGAVGVITINSDDSLAGNTLITPDLTIPVFAYIPLHVGQQLYSDTGGVAGTQMVHMKADLLTEDRVTYNVIADSKYGDPNNVVILGGHYDSIYGAGILDNASGVASMMEIAAAVKDTKTYHHLRFAFWGGEELGTFGSQYYIDTLPSKELNKIIYNLDFDVTATPNFTYDISDPAYALANPSGNPVSGIELWKNNAVKKSSEAIKLFKSYMGSVGLPYTSERSDVNITGSDDNPFIQKGVPIGSLVTGQGGGKTDQDASIFGGTAGYFDTCADAPYVFCDNMSNIDSNVMATVTKAFAAVTVGIVFDHNLNSTGNAYAVGHTTTGSGKKNP